MLIKVKAKIYLDKDKPSVLYLDVPEEKCNRAEFENYIKEHLIKAYSNEIKYEYSVVE